MKPASPRRFTIADAMILVATFAVGWFGVRSTVGGLTVIRRIFERPLDGVTRRELTILVGLSILVSYLAALTPAILAMRFLRPRPAARRLFRQPGTVACVAALLAMLIEAGWVASLLAMKSRLMAPDKVFAWHATQVGFAVIGGWLALTMSGRCSPESSWVDRAGRVVGFGWITATILWWSLDYFH